MNFNYKSKMNIQRARFYTPENVPRQTREMVAMRNEVTLSDRTLNALFKVDTPDPNDQQFLQGAEEISRKHPSWTREEVEIHFGRKQRTFSTKVNPGQQRMDLKTKLAGLKHMTAQAAGDSKDDENVLASVMDIIKTERVALNTPDVKKQLRFALDTLDLPDLSHEAGLPRFVKKVDDTMMAFLLAKTTDSFPYIDDDGEQLPLNIHVINQRLSKGGVLDLDMMEIQPDMIEPSRRQKITGYNLRRDDERKHVSKYTPTGKQEDAGDY